MINRARLTRRVFVSIGACRKHWIKSADRYNQSLITDTCYRYREFYEWRAVLIGKFNE